MNLHSIIATKLTLHAAPGAETCEQPIFTLGGIETVLAAGFVVLFLWTSDPWARAIGEAVAWLVAAPWAVLVLPAMILGMLGRNLPLALGMLLAAAPVTVLALYHS